MTSFHENKHGKRFPEELGRVVSSAPKFKTDGPIVRALWESALAGPPKKKRTLADPAPKKTDGPLVRALFERALAGPAPKKKVVSC